MFDFVTHFLFAAIFLEQTTGRIIRLSFQKFIWAELVSQHVVKLTYYYPKYPVQGQVRFLRKKISTFWQLLTNFFFNTLYLTNRMIFIFESLSHNSCTNIVSPPKRSTVLLKAPCIHVERVLMAFRIIWTVLHVGTIIASLRK